MASEPPPVAPTSPEPAGAHELPPELVQAKNDGNEAFRNGQFEAAIKEYSAALKLVRLTLDTQASSPTNSHLVDVEATLFSNRSAAFASLSRKYLSRPAARSESSALFGLDPRHLASLALSDAQKVMSSRPTWTKAHSRLGCALFLSERYAEAEAAYLAGLSLEPDSLALQEGLAEVAKVLKGDDEDTGGADADDEGTEAALNGRPSGGGSETCLATTSSGNAATPSSKRQRTARKCAAPVDDFECTLCLKLFYEPVTTSCGHTFCRACFTRAIDHKNKCPVCRTLLHTDQDLPVTVTLQNILQKSFPQEYAERCAEEAAEQAAADRAGTGGAILPALPLFVMNILLPGERMGLNIFEPRYRLMVRRAMEGNRRIGTAQRMHGEANVEPLATESEIIDCSRQPDGRYSLEVVGRRRVELMEQRELDGYRVARARVLADTPAEAGSAEAAELQGLVTAVGERLEELLARLRVLAAAGRGMQSARIRMAIEQAGPRPPADKPEELSFWAGTLVITFSPRLDYEDKLVLLRMTRTHERLTWVKQQLDAMPGAAGSGDGAGGPALASDGGCTIC